MTRLEDTFLTPSKRSASVDDTYSRDEVRLANRNSGALVETLGEEITPIGTHYLLNHFDVPVLDASSHRLRFEGAFDAPFDMGMEEIRALPEITMPVTLECAGNGRAGVSPRSRSMPWMYEAVGTSAWTGTPLAPLVERAKPRGDVVELSFTGVDFGFDRGSPHYFGRALSMQQLRDLDVMLVWGMNGQDLLPQHGAPLRIIVPGWYGMASVKWLTRIAALTEPYQGFQQVKTYQFRKDEDDPGVPITAIRVKSLMVPPGVPDWLSRARFVEPGLVPLAGRAWSGLGVPIARVEVGVNGVWADAKVLKPQGKYAWSKWEFDWQAEAGSHVLQCRATDAEGNVQPLEAPWDLAGFANNAVHRLDVLVAEMPEIED